MRHGIRLKPHACFICMIQRRTFTAHQHMKDTNETSNATTKWFWIIAFILSLYFCLFSVEKINLVTADIGRHIKNGEIFLHSGEFGISKSEILHTNLFSYTYPDFSFINHHWGSGVIAYLIYSV